MDKSMFFLGAGVGCISVGFPPIAPLMMTLLKSPGCPAEAIGGAFVGSGIGGLLHFVTPIAAPIIGGVVLLAISGALSNEAEIAVN